MSTADATRQIESKLSLRSLLRQFCRLVVWENVYWLLVIGYCLTFNGYRLRSGDDLVVWEISRLVVWEISRLVVWENVYWLLVIV